MTLRPLKVFDAPNYVRWFKDKRVVRHMLLQTGISLVKEREYIKNLKNKKDGFNLAIITETGKHIGGTGTSFDKNNSLAKTGIVIGEVTCWNKGYATETLKIVANYVLKKLKYNRLELVLDMSNKAAFRVYKKVGFVLEGVRRKAHYNLITKRFEDEGVMSVLREEWLKNYKF